jgi:hypothetical protein
MAVRSAVNERLRVLGCAFGLFLGLEVGFGYHLEAFEKNAKEAFDL